MCSTHEAGGLRDKVAAGINPAAHATLVENDPGKAEVYGHR